MLNRWVGILSAFCMLLANGAIIWRDILPDWLAGDPPPNEALLLSPGEKRFAQVGIYDDDDRTIGKSWTLSHRVGVGGSVNVKTTTVLEPLHLAGGIATPRVRVETSVTYRFNETTVDELEFRMFGLGLPVSLHAEAMPSGEFPCQWQVGSERHKFVLDSRVPVALGDVIRPFDRLPNLYVGRRWRLDLLDPLTQIFPQLRNTPLAPESVSIHVTDRTTISHAGDDVEVFVVEGGGATAWVAPDGRVLRQEVQLPLLGRLILLDEPYDDAARRKAVRDILGGPEDQPEPSDAERGRV